MTDGAAKNVLGEIICHKRTEVSRLKEVFPLESLRSEVEQMPARDAERPFEKALRREERISFLAELKRGSPSRGSMAPSHSRFPKIALTSALKSYTPSRMKWP